MLALAPLFLLPAVQFARPSTIVDEAAGNVLDLLSLATSGDLTVAAYRVHNDGSAWVATSDGRGVQWSEPVPLDLVPDGAQFVINSRLDVAVLDGVAYLAWADDRFFSSGLSPLGTAFLRTYEPSTGLLGPEVWLPTGAPMGTSTSRVRALEAVEVDDQAHLHMLLRTSGPSTLRLLSSHDGGQTFPFIHELPQTIASNYATTASMAVEGTNVHVVWQNIDEAGTHLLLHTSSSDGGATLVNAAPREIAAAPYSFRGPAVDVSGDRLIVGWAESTLGPVGSFSQDIWRVYSTMSDDGGQSFAPTALHFTGASSYDQANVMDAHVDGATGTGLFLFASDDMHGTSTRCFRVHSTDGGLSWGAPDLWSVHDGDGVGAIVADGQDRGRVVTIHSGRDFEVDLQNDPESGAALSTDGGVTFGTPVPLGKDLEYAAAAVYNDHYQSATVLLLKMPGTKTLRAGGLRPQTIIPRGFGPGPTTISAEFENFEASSAGSYAWMLLSLAPGSLPLPDGRVTGLGSSLLLDVSLDLVSAGAFAVPLDPDGSGSIAPLPTVFPLGLTITAVGLSLDLANGTIGDLSDAVPIKIQ